MIYIYFFVIRKALSVHAEKILKILQNSEIKEEKYEIIKQKASPKTMDMPSTTNN